MKKTLSFGKVAYGGINKVNEVTVRIELTDEDKPVFTVSAAVWFANHNDMYMGGQCLDTIWEKFGTQINNPTLYKKIIGLWERNHLNKLNGLYRPINEEDLQAIKEILQ